MSDVWVMEGVDDGWVAQADDTPDGFVAGAGYSTVAQYRPDRKGRCKANGDTCKARQAKGTDYCAGHLRSFGMLKKEEPDGDAAADA